MTIRLGSVVGIALSLTLAIVHGAMAASFTGQTLRVQQWPTGPEAEALKKYVIDPFIKETGANIVVEYGHTTASIAKIRAQKDDPQLDVVLLDDIGVYTLAREGLLDQLDLSKLENAKYIFPNYVLANSHGIGVTTYIATILYNTKLMATAPTSWNDLWDPKYKGKVVLPPANVARAPLLALMAAKLNGGGIDNMAPAWPKLQELKPNVYSFLENRALSAEDFRSGQAAMTIDLVAFWKPYVEKGVPVAMAGDLKEGFFAFTGAASLVKGGKGNRELAYAFIDKVLSAEAQRGFAEDNWFGPTNRNVKVSLEAAKYMAVTPEQVARAIPLDQLKMLDLRPEIIKQWNTIFVH